VTTPKTPQSDLYCRPRESTTTSKTIHSTW
jgi:hypothetical protein